MFARPLLILLLSTAVVACTACGGSVNFKEAVQVTEPSGGWYDAGIVDGKNKIVPAVTFRLRKTPDAELSSVSLNVVFRHPPAEGSNLAEDWDEVFLQRADFSGDVTEPVTVRTEKGYTGDPPQSRADLLRHSSFRDVRAHVYAKHSSSQWVEVGVIDVQRQLLVR